ncbi:MAG: hypothetical protein ACREBR_01640, partial [bacterium]
DQLQEQDHYQQQHANMTLGTAVLENAAVVTMLETSRSCGEKSERKSTRDFVIEGECSVVDDNGHYSQLKLTGQEEDDDATVAQDDNETVTSTSTIIAITSFEEENDNISTKIDKGNVIDLSINFADGGDERNNSQYSALTENLGNDEDEMEFQGQVEIRNYITLGRVGTATSYETRSSSNEEKVNYDDENKNTGNDEVDENSDENDEQNSKNDNGKETLNDEGEPESDSYHSCDTSSLHQSPISSTNTNNGNDSSSCSHSPSSGSSSSNDGDEGSDSVLSMAMDLSHLLIHDVDTTNSNDEILNVSRKLASNSNNAVRSNTDNDFDQSNITKESVYNHYNISSLSLQDGTTEIVGDQVSTRVTQVFTNQQHERIQKEEAAREISYEQNTQHGEKAAFSYEMTDGHGASCGNASESISKRRQSVMKVKESDKTERIVDEAERAYRSKSKNSNDSD